MAMLDAHANELRRSMTRRLADSAQTLDWLSRRLVSPVAYIGRQRLQLRGLQSRLAHAAQSSLRQARYQLANMQTRLRSTLPDTASHRIHLVYEGRRMTALTAANILRQRNALDALNTQLALLDPQRTLERGYAIVMDSKGKAIRAPKDLQPRDVVTMRLAEGTATVGIASVQPGLE